MFKLLKYLQKRDYFSIFVVISIVLLHVWFDLRLPDHMADITKYVQSTGQNMEKILLAGFFMLLCALGSVITDVFIFFIVSRISARLVMNIRKSLYSKVILSSAGEIAKYTVPSLITRTTNDMIQIQNVFTIGLIAVLKYPLMAILAIVKIYNKNLSWTITTAVAVGVLVTMLSSIFLFAIPRFKRIQRATDNLNKLTRENLKGIKVIRACNAEKYQESKFDKTNCEFYNTNLRVQYAMSFVHPGMDLIMSGLTLAIYCVGIYLISASPISGRIDLFSNMVVFSGYSAQVMMAFIRFSMTFVFLPRGEVSAKRINEILSADFEIKSGNMTTSPQGTKGEIEFKDVSFKYPNSKEYALRNINFKVNQGEVIAFVGSTGSGKSTIMDLILRFYDVTSGEILIDGINIKKYNLNALRNKLGYVSQNAFIFKGSISSNIKFGKDSIQDSNDETLEKSIKISQSNEFISTMEGRCDAQLSQAGLNLSGGQKQRISIARAIYKQPEIYLFDDAFSSLDYKTDKKIRQGLKREINGITTIITSQRASNIMYADKIIVLELGEIVGIGSHTDLINTCKIYREIINSQLSEGDLLNV